MDIDQLCINTIRTLAIDAVQKANSGHPGTPMGLAPVAYCLWNDFLRFDPTDPIWPNRDRFVLSCGHASMLLYSLLYLTKVKAVNAQYEILGKESVSLEDIKNFRQLGSRCPGHPEYRWTSGIETTTGPLGQGVSNSVGMAIASHWMEGYFNKPDFPIMGYNVYAICGDGDLMEGVSSEAASYAGHLKLSNLCWIYDSNHITIEGSTDLTFTEDVKKRFSAYGWKVLEVKDANDLDAIRLALKTFQENKSSPTLIVMDSKIGYGSPHKEGTASAHGEPLGEEEVKLTKKAYGWPEDKTFYVPEEVHTHFESTFIKKGKEFRETWMKQFEAYKKAHPELADALYKMQHRELPKSWDEGIKEFPPDPKGLASRDSSGQVLNHFAKKIPWLMGGAADLAPSTKTLLKFEGAEAFSVETPTGQNFHFGIREHAMGSIVNGMCLSKIRAFGAGFFIFSDYLRPILRLGALMEIPSLFIFTHDSIGVGEDGPTHQPIEQLASLRAIPGLLTMRPCDANEVLEAWKFLLPTQHEPCALILSRQKLPTLDRSKYAKASGLRQGAYILIDCEKTPDLILIGTGSEVHLCLEVHEKLKEKKIHSRVVSMPCWELFEKQDKAYQESVLPSSVKKRISVEQGSTFGWERYVTSEGVAIGMETFGASAPLKQLLKKFGFTTEDVVKKACDLLNA